MALKSLEWELFQTGVSFLTIRSNIMWKLGDYTDNTMGGRRPYLWDEAIQQWKLEPSGWGTSLSIGQNLLFIVNYFSRVYQRPRSDSTSGWTSPLLLGNDVKTGFNGDVWFIDNTPITGGFGINKYNPNTFALTLVNGAGAVKVAPTPDGNAWIVNNADQILRYDGTNWNLMPGSAKEIIIGEDGIPFIVSSTVTDGGFEIKKWNQSATQWDTLEGIGGISLALDDRNNPHIVTSNFSVYRPKISSLLNFCSST